MLPKAMRSNRAKSPQSLGRHPGFRTPDPYRVKAKSRRAGPHFTHRKGWGQRVRHGKKGTDGGLLTHGVSIATLAHDVLNDPDATVREAALAGWVLNELEERGDD